MGFFETETNLQILKILYPQTVSISLEIVNGYRCNTSECSPVFLLLTLGHSWLEEQLKNEKKTMDKL